MSESPAWLDSLTDTVANSIEAHSAMGPLGYRYYQEGDDWELIIYPTPVELMGGAEDGTIVIAGFSVDIQLLLSAFDQVVALRWIAQGFGPYDADGPYLSIEGSYQGHNVWMRVLAAPPNHEPPGLQLEVFPPREGHRP